MNTWLKNICLNSLKFGLNQTNYIIINFVKFFFNMYGKKLFKIEDNKLIKSIDFLEDRNNINFYPIEIKEMYQNFNLNTFKIVEGLFENMIISIPWKNILSETTFIIIDNVKIKIDIVKSQSIYFSALENYNSYLYNESTVEHDENLINIFKEIHQIIISYFNKVNIKINTIIIEISNYFKIIANDVSYDINFHIKQLYFEDNNNNILINIDDLVYFPSENKIVILNVNIDLAFIDCLPNFYMEESGSELTLSIIILNITIDKLLCNNISININSEKIIINHVNKVIVDDILIIDKIENIILFDLNKKLMEFNGIITLRLSSFEIIIDWLNHFLKKIKRINTKLIFVQNKVGINNIFIFGTKIDLYYKNDLFHILIKKIIINDSYYIYDCVLKYNDLNINIKECIINDKNILLLITNAISDEFKLLSSKIIIKMTQNKSHVHQNNMGVTVFKKLDIMFYDTNATNVDKIVNYINTMIDKFGSSTNNENNIFINLYINNGTIKYTFDNINLHFVINESNISITHMNATKSNVSIMINNYIIAEFESSIISKNMIMIESVRIFIDPEIFDKLNFLFGILNPDENETNVEVQNLMSQTFIVNNIEELQNSTDELLKDIIDDYENTFDNNISKQLFNEIIQNNLVIKIKMIHINLYDKLPIYKYSYKPFLIIIVKNLEIIKNIINLSNQMDNIIRIVQQGKHRPNIKNKYLIKVFECTILDMTTNNPEWKYFLKFNKNENIIDMEIIYHGDTCTICINIVPLTVNINEKTLIRILSFFSNNYKSSNNIYIEQCMIGEVNIILNYYPIIANSDIFSVKNFKIRLSSQNIQNVYGFGTLINIILNNWNNDLNPTNIIQFVPNIKLIQPYAVPIVRLINIITKYFKKSNNKKKARSISREITKGVDIVSKMMKLGFENIWD